MEDLLEKYGTRWIDLRKLRNGATQALAIGRNYVPPLGGISVIEEEHVAKPQHRLRLEAAGYKPWAVTQPVGWSVWSIVSLVVLALLGVMGCVSC